MKRLLFFTLLSFVSLTLLAEDFVVDGIKYRTTSSNTVEVIRNSYSGNIVIPESVENNGITYSVTSIGSDAFNGCSGMTSVTIPNSVTSIGERVFYGCSGLTSVTIPNSVTSIGSDAFYGCSGMTSVTIPNSVTSIGERVFYGCRGLTSVTIPNSVTSIGASAFSFCGSITSITIPNSVTSIGASAFYSCRGLTSITIPNSVTTLGNYAFSYCSGLTSIVLGNSVKSIGNWAFDNCDSLAHITFLCPYISSWFSGKAPIKEIIFEEGVTTIGRDAFKNCYNLSSVSFSNSITSIEEGAFKNCKGIKSVTFGNSIETIGNSAFSGCSCLLSVNIPDSIKSIGYEAFPDLISITFHCPVIGPWSPAYPAVKNVILEEGVSSIGDRAFYHSGNLESVTMSNSITSIGDFAFEGCGNLTSLTLSNSVTSIGKLAFHGCGLTSIVIPNGVTDIDVATFKNCKQLTSITIPPSVTSIGGSYGDWYYYGGTFEGCTELDTVIISDLRSWCNIDFTAALASPLRYAKHLFLNEKEINDLIIPNNVNSIKQFTFSDYLGLVSVSIPNSVSSIHQHAFLRCDSLTSVSIDCDVIGTFFNNTKSIKEFTIGENVDTIRASAFNGCDGFHLKVLSATPPILEYRIDNTNLETTNGASINYSLAKNWCEFDTIYTVKNGIRYYPIPITHDGEKFISINGNYEGYELPEGEVATITLNDKKDLYIVTQNGKYINDDLEKYGKYSFGINKCHKYNLIYSCAYTPQVVNLNSAGTLINEFDIENLENITSLKISGNINGTDILTIRKMTNLKFLDLEDANIVNGGSSYYENYVTSKDAIGDYFFKNKEKIVNIKLPQSITQIKSYAFKGCKNLMTITIPSNVEIVGNKAFEGCESLIYANIQCSNIGNWFDYPQSLREVVIGDETRKIGENAFKGCINLEKVSIGISVETIGKCAFLGCGLWRIEIPSSVTYIGDEAFYGCRKLREFHISDGASELRLYGSGGCKYCGYLFSDESLTEVYIGRNLSYYSNSPWQYISTLENISFGGYVTNIPDYAFEYCHNITSVIIGKSVKTIGKKAFYECSNLTHVELPNSLLLIDDYAFSDCIKLTTVVGDNESSLSESNSLSSIGKGAFMHCKNLLSIDMPNNIKTISGNCFNGCTSLTSVAIPDSVERIGVCAFYDCRNLVTVVFGTKVKSIDEQAFENCKSLNNVNLPYTLTSIGLRAFTNCESLTSISIPDGITILDDESNLSDSHCGIFEGCKSLTQVDLGNGIVILGSRVFKNCSALTNISFPENVKTIGPYAFQGCTSLKSLYIPRSLNRIEVGAFDDCTSLQSLIIEDGKEPLILNKNSYRIASFFANSRICEAYIGRDFIAEWSFGFGSQKIVFPFCSQKELVNVTIGDYVTNITMEAFKDCSELSTIVIPDSVKTVGIDAFNGCVKLSNVRIGKSVTSIGERAFQGCKEIVDIISLNSTPPSINENTFEEETYSKAILYVTQGNINIYRLHPYWEKFVKMQEIDMSDLHYTLTYIVDDEIYKTYELKAGDTIIPDQEPTKDGYTFSGWSEIPSVMPNHNVTVSGTFTKNEDGLGIDECVVTNDDFDKPIYNLRGLRVTNPKNGIYIVNGKKVFVK